jgi:hypothetical protein
MKKKLTFSILVIFLLLGSTNVDAKNFLKKENKASVFKSTANLLKQSGKKSRYNYAKSFSLKKDFDCTVQTVFIFNNGENLIINSTAPTCAEAGKNVDDFLDMLLSFM